MNFSCVKEKLEYAASSAERFTGKNTTLPVLENILLELKDNTLRIAATNLEYALEVSVTGRGKKDGRISIPAKIFHSFLQSTKDTTVELEGKNGILTVKSPLLQTKINGTTADDFPLIPKIKPHTTFWVESSLLRNGIEKVLPAVSLSEFKPELNGILFKVTPSILYLAATDTFRLAEKTIPLSKTRAGETLSFILPHRVSQELRRALGENSEIKIAVGDNQVYFAGDQFELTSRLIDGSFPEYAGIVPQDFETKCFLKRSEVLDAVRASSIFSSKLSDVSLYLDEGFLTVHSMNPEVGEYKTQIEAAMSGKGASIHFNYRYLLDGLAALESDDFFFGCNNENSPAVLKNKNDGSYLYLVMPIKVS